MSNETVTFEQALGQLEGIVEEIEQGRIGLEESIARYEQGITLIKQCRTILDEAEKRIQLLAKGEGEQLAVAGELRDLGDLALADPTTAPRQPAGDQDTPF